MGDQAQDQGQAPNNAQQTAAAPSGPKHDEFYKYWDRFLCVREKKPKPKTYNLQLADARSHSDSIRNVLNAARRGAARTPAELPQGVSLERDIEGRPGHPMVRSNTAGNTSRQSATTSYDEAVASCRAKVEAIRQECRRLNQKYYDRMFDLPQPDTLSSLAASQPYSLKDLVGVGSVKRVEDIYEEPEFFIDGATANDIRQGSNGDCWFLAAISALTSKPELIDRLCVARDAQVGVYGFVFYRDGEWISEVVDDRLCLGRSDDNKNFETEYMLVTGGERNPRREALSTMLYGITDLPQDFRDRLRKGSDALFFASCRESNETWVPLLEKAYAKAHGDYQALEAGFAGEALEDLTGGVATYISSEDVLDKDTLWSELLQVNDKFLFGCASRRGRDSNPADEQGFVRGHAYTVLAAKEIAKPDNIIKEEERTAQKAGRAYSEKKRNEKIRMLKVQNPWGRQEWNGAWSDGSKEWTPEVMRELDHTFGDDGIFWISYPDFLKYYPEIDRVRLFGPEWTVAKQWTTVKVPYNADYLDTHFSLDVSEEGPVVLVLCQPDERYYRGMKGRYSYELHFRLYKEGEETYLLRSMESAGSDRSCSAELTLAPGRYTVLVKIVAERTASANTPEEVIKMYRESRREKLFAIGKSLDAVQSKGRFRRMEENDAKQERVDNKAEDRQEKIDQRNANLKKRQRDRARRKRREEEEKRKKENKIREIKEKRKAKKAAEKQASLAKENDETKAVDDDDTSSAENGHPTPESTPDETKAEQPVLLETDETSAQPESTPTSTDSAVQTEETTGQGDETTTEAQPNATSEEKQQDQTAPSQTEEEQAESDLDVSECSDVDDNDFEWDDAVDGSGDESVDDEASEDEDGMFKDDPWSARCVIGLRVYGLDKGVVIRVQQGDSGHEQVEEHE